MRLLFVLPVALALGLRADELGSRRPYLEAARQFEMRPLAARPDWATRPDPPLARMVWFTDLHLNKGYLPLAEQALAYMNALKPDAVLVTGDNCAYAPDGFRPELTDRNVRRWAFFQHLLDSTLQAPSAVLPGDNWPWGYDQVYGARQFSFDLAGVRFLCLAVDRAARGVEGCAVFDEKTWAWLARELEGTRDRPVIVAMHENCVPPTFLDAGRLLRLLQAHPQVLATFTGHLHLDLDFAEGNLRHLVCPALGPSLRHGLKHIAIHADAILLQTHEIDEASKEYGPVEIWQRIEIPARLRPALRPVERPFALVKRDGVPASPMVADPSLRNRSGELLAPAMRFVMSHGIQALRPAR